MPSRPAEPLVRAGFATSDDGLHLYWRAVGPADGGLGTLVCCNGVGVSLFFWKYLVEHYSRQYTVLLWDYRAHGRSDRPSPIADADFGIARHARDLAAVMDAAGVPNAMLLGHSMGVQVIIEFYRLFPARVRGLVTVLGTAGRALDTFYDNPRSPAFFRAAGRLIDTLGERIHWIVRPLMESPLAWFVTRNAQLVDPYYAKREDMLKYLDHLARLDMRIFIKTVLAMNDHDAWPVLATIRVPTLVIAAEKDTFTPGWLSRKMAASIPGADFLLLADASHAAIIEQPDTIHHRVDRFLAERRVFGARAVSSAS